MAPKALVVPIFYLSEHRSNGRGWAFISLLVLHKTIPPLPMYIYIHRNTYYGEIEFDAYGNYTI